MRYYLRTSLPAEISYYTIATISVDIFRSGL